MLKKVQGGHLCPSQLQRFLSPTVRLRGVFIVKKCINILAMFLYLSDKCLIFASKILITTKISK